MLCKCFIRSLLCEFLDTHSWADYGLMVMGKRLLFMTYNGWVMLAVAVGAFMGYMTFGNSSAARNVACH